MKKLIGIALVVALAVMLMPSAVFAWDPVEINGSWSGTGSFDQWIDAGGDAYTEFHTSGAVISGQFAGQYVENTSYPYMDCNTWSTYANARVTDGGIEYWTNRTDSYEGSYGPSGQSSYSLLTAYGGTGEMAMGSWTNYASQKDCLYSSTGQKLGVPVRTSGGHHFEANATDYFMMHNISAPDGDWAYVRALGSGTAALDCMNNEMGADNLRLGWGCGCYTDADFSATGAGQFDAYGIGNNFASNVAGSSSGPGSWASLSFGWSGGGSCTVPDYSTTVQ